jgi:hypothetical protein
MAEVGLDIVIRSMGKKQHKALIAKARKRQARLMGLSAKAKTKESKARYRQAAKDTMLLANAAARRLLITAENTADSYARAMKRALEDLKVAAEAVKAKPTKKSAKNKS